jgi:hypothetical protein
MTRTLVAAVVVLLSACSRGGAETQPAPSVLLDRAAADVVVAGAEAAMQQALAGLNVARLPSHFAGHALQRLIDRVGWMRTRGLRLQERSSRRALVSWDMNAGEAVLQVAAQVRLVSAEQPEPPWSNTLRQWWSRLAFHAGGWVVVDDRDLSPEQWRPATTWIS